MLEKVQTTKSQIDTGMKGKQIACQVLNFSNCEKCLKDRSKSMGAFEAAITMRPFVFSFWWLIFDI